MRPVSSGVALIGGGVALAAVAPAGWVALAVGGVGVVSVVVGIVRRRRAAVTAGSLLVFAGVLVAGVHGLPPGLALFGTLAAIVTWDSGTHGIELDEQIGLETPAVRGEAVHAGTTLVVGVVIASLAYLVALVSAGRFPALAAIAIVAGVWFLAMGLEPYADPARQAS